jgi:hypothetical protein
MSTIPLKILTWANTWASTWNNRAYQIGRRRRPVVYTICMRFHCTVAVARPVTTLPIVNIHTPRSGTTSTTHRESPLFLLSLFFLSLWNNLIKIYFILLKSVREISASSLQDPNAYILFYQLKSWTNMFNKQSQLERQTHTCNNYFYRQNQKSIFFTSKHWEKKKKREHDRGCECIHRSSITVKALAEASLNVKKCKRTLNFLIKNSGFKLNNQLTHK